ncbi:hypothetical protein EII17_07310 [Clostridiales bacterium COT073_COT-073]|nr:hypothetical protein EII17_07310 [Clostridiales bacterium COT073_COT-073]
MKKQLISAILCDIGLYLLQFLLIPAISFKLVTGDHEMIVVLCLTTIIVTMVGVIFFTDRLRHWLLALIIYVLLIFLYSPLYAYDIGVINLTLDGLTARYDPGFRYFGILLIAFLVLFLQSAICLIAKLIRYHQNKQKMKTTGER